MQSLQKARGASQRLRRVRAARGIGKRTKIRLFKTLVGPVLYGCETWKITKNDERKLNSFPARASQVNLSSPKIELETVYLMFTSLKMLHQNSRRISLVLGQQFNHNIGNYQIILAQTRPFRVLESCVLS